VFAQVQFSCFAWLTQKQLWKFGQLNIKNHRFYS